MRIALIWNFHYIFSQATAPYAEYHGGFAQLGHEVLPFFRPGTEDGYPFPVDIFDGELIIEDPAFWASTGCDIGVLFTFHQMTNVIRAMRIAGLRVLAIGDSDTQISPRLHPWETFRYMTYLQPSWRGKLGATKHWLQRFLYRAGAEHRALSENTAAAEVFSLAGQGAVDEFRRTLSRIGSPELRERIAWVPYPVPEMFCVSAVNRNRANRVIAIGRWDSPQKNPGLLAATIRRLHAAGDQTEILIVGRAAEKRFAHLARRNPRVQVLGIQPRERIRELMAECRAVLIPSRWESGPIVANEMLALGGTVVGTPFLNLRALTVDGQFGRVSRFHAAGALANAVREEMAAWDRGKRDPMAIAAHWRELVSPVAVAGRMLNLLGLHASHTQVV